MSGSRPSVPALVARVVSEELKGSAFIKRGRNAWVLPAHKATVAISLSAIRLGGDLVGVSVGAFAVPAVVPRVLWEYFGDGLNARGIAWSVDQRDFGGPETYVVTSDGAAPQVAPQLRRMVTEDLRPAAEYMLGGDHLLTYVRRHALMRPSGWDEIVRFAAMSLDEGEPEAAVAAIRSYAAVERERWAAYSSAPWQPPVLDGEWTALRQAYPAFNPGEALRA